MLSIIICSRQAIIKSELTENIHDTIGCKYELIVIDNSQNQFSIFEAYNLGIERSVYNYLCFIHDDVLFHTNNWGRILQKKLIEDQNIGLIGVAGAKIKTKMPSAWWDCPHNQKSVNIIQHFNNKEKKYWNFGFDEGLLTSVAVIDGVFMAARKDVRVRFNNKMNGFHNYDLNISFEYIKNGFDVVVTNEILIEHFSFGTVNDDWIKSTLLIHEIYNKFLPLKTNCKLSDKIVKQIEFKNGASFLSTYLDFNLKYYSIKIWIRLIFLNPFSKFHFKFLKEILK